jgi:hypothetical protein
MAVLPFEQSQCPLHPQSCEQLAVVQPVSHVHTSGAVQLPFSLEHPNWSQRGVHVSPSPVYPERQEHVYDGMLALPG